MPTATTTPTRETTAPTERPTADALARERDALIRERAGLALDEPTGTRLTGVRARLQEIAMLLDDLALAEAETQRRTAEREAKARADREAQDRARLDVLETVEIPALAAEADTALATAALAVARLQTLVALAARLRAGLGLASRSRTDGLAVSGSVLWRLGAVLGARAPVGQVHHGHRVPLATLFTPPAETRPDA